jgi:hypothetical protein
MDKKITVSGLQKVEIEITEKELAWAIMGIVQNRLGGIDDAGCDWFTEAGSTYIGNEREWVVSHDPDISFLVDAANILSIGHRMELEN